MAKKKKYRFHKAPASTTRASKASVSATPNSYSRDSAMGGGSLKVELCWALGLSVLAWIHRLLFLYSNRDREWPFTIFYEGDSEAFFHFARAVLDGKPYDEGLPFHPPGFAYVLAWVHDLLGAGAGVATIPHLQVKVLLAAFSSLTVGLLYLLIRPYLGRTVALLAALLASYHFGLYVVAIAPVTEGIYLTLYLAAWWLFVSGLEHPLTAPGAAARHPLLAAGILGVLCGGLALIRAEAMLLPFLFVGIGLWGWWGRRRSADIDGLNDLRASVAWRPWAVLLLACGFTILPWTLHNHRAISALNAHYGARLAEPIPTFVPITIYGPLNLALANNAAADGTFSRDTLSSQKFSGNLDLEDPQHLDFILHGDRYARQWILNNPVDFMFLVGKKWELVSRVFTLGWSQWNWPGGLDGVRRPVDVFTPDSTFLRWLLIPLVLLGAWFCLKAGAAAQRWLGVVFAASLVGAVSTTVFYGYVRQGLLMLPFALSLMGVACAVFGWRGLSMIRQRAAPDRRLLGAMAIMVALFLVVEAIGVQENRNFEASGTTKPGSQKLNRDQPVTLKLLPAK